MKVLECPVFANNNPLTGEMIWAMRTNGGSEVIKESLTNNHKWDGSSNVASIAATLQDGEIDGWNLHLFGLRKGL